MALHADCLTYLLDLSLDFCLIRRMQHSDIIKAIEAHAAAYKLKPTTIGQLSVQNRNVYDRLVSGKDIQMGTAYRLLEWIAADAETRSANAKTPTGAA